MPSSAPVVSVVMVAFGGGWRWVPRALQALRANTAEPYEVILVDNGGADEPRVDDPAVDVIRNRRNLGFGPGSNQGASRARGDVLVFLNTDALVEPGWLPPLLERLPDDDVGAVFPAKLNLDGTLQEAGAFVTGEANAYVFGDGEAADTPDYAFSREIDFGSAAATCLTRSRFAQVFGFDPNYTPAYYEDADFCFRLREQGFRSVFEPRARVTHARTVSAPSEELRDLYAANRELFVARWAPEIDGRPGYDLLASDAAVRLEARDALTSRRVLIVGSELEQALALASDRRTRVTLLTDQSDQRDALRAAGVEVVLTERAEEWLRGRAGHYTEVFVRSASGLESVVRETQPAAALTAA